MFADLQLIQIIFLFLFPLYVLYLEKSGYKITSWLSPVLLCYLAGIISANIPFLKIDNSVSSRVSELAILIAIPMLLFSTDLLKWLRLAPKTVLAYIFVIFSVMTSSVIFGLMARDYFEDSWKLSGMLVGVYTGGTPNMSAIGIALDVEESLFVLVNAADVMLGGIYLVFLLTIAKKLLRNIMPDFKKNKNITGFIPQEKSGDHKKKMHDYLLSFFYSICLVSLCFGLVYLLKNEINVPLLILLLTSLSIALSFIPGVKRNKANYPAGEYFILVFSLAIGTLVDIGQILSTGLQVVSYTAIIMFTTIIVHYILCAVFRIDADTAIITSVAGIYGPPFVAAISKVLKNKEIIISGMTTGLIGYAIGNYLGIGLGLWLKP